MYLNIALFFFYLCLKRIAADVPLSPLLNIQIYCNWCAKYGSFLYSQRLVGLVWVKVINYSLRKCIHWNVRWMHQHLLKLFIKVLNMRGLNSMVLLIINNRYRSLAFLLMICNSIKIVKHLVEMYDYFRDLWNQVIGDDILFNV